MATSCKALRVMTEEPKQKEWSQIYVHPVSRGRCYVTLQPIGTTTVSQGHLQELQLCSPAPVCTVSLQCGADAAADCSSVWFFSSHVHQVFTAAFAVCSNLEWMLHVTLELWTQSNMLIGLALCFWGKKKKCFCIRGFFYFEDFEFCTPTLPYLVLGEISHSFCPSLSICTLSNAV